MPLSYNYIKYGNKHTIYYPIWYNDRVTVRQLFVSGYSVVWEVVHGCLTRVCNQPIEAGSYLIPTVRGRKFDNPEVRNPEVLGRESNFRVVELQSVEDRKFDKK